ncbi:MAG: enoyl-CoA hydratase/carnithine racemase, partial [Myxococcota bacterium]
MAIHYDKTSSEIPEHVVVITIDRPETKNALDLYHFRDLAPAA